MNALNLHATPSGDYAPASSLTAEEALALKNQLSPEEILHELSPEARASVLASYGLRAHQPPHGEVVVVWSEDRTTGTYAEQP